MNALSMLIFSVRCCFALTIVGAALNSAGWGAVARAAELIVFERAGCVRCLAWEHEIASIYPKTEEGVRAPLRRVDLVAPRPPDLATIAEVKYTPTFVLLDDGREIGRIVGYNGDEFFWAEVKELLSRLPQKR